MKGQRVGYIRVSTADQNADRQLQGIELDRVFTDKAGGKDTQRPELSNMINFLREGDNLFVHSMDRLARNLDDLRNIVKTLTARGVKINFIKEGLIFSGDDSPMSTLLLSVMGAFAEFERSLIKERQKEGIAIAKSKGKYTGRKPSLNHEQIGELKRLAVIGVPKSKLAENFKVSRETIYQYLKIT
jgi:DNA invertase Pin-like site-specific DNA recombinase